MTSNLNPILRMAANTYNTTGKKAIMINCKTMFLIFCDPKHKPFMPQPKGVPKFSTIYKLKQKIYVILH